VLSADSTNTSTYSIVTGTLNGDVSLNAKAGFTVMVDGDKVSGFGYDALILDVLAGVTSNPLSVINVVQNDTVPVPLMNVRYDQEIDTIDGVPTSTYQYMESHVFDGVQFKVVAENGNRKLYTLQPTLPTGDIYVTSNFFDVNEGDTRFNSNIPRGLSVPAILSHLDAPGDAVVTIRNAAGYTRTEGTPKWNDFVDVTTADGLLTAKYYLIFVGNTDPIGTLEKAKGTQVSIKETFLAGSLVNLYPNPATEMVTFENVPQNSVIQIISLSGSMVYSSSQVSEKMTISTAKFDKGMYFVRIVEKGGSSVIKMLVK
jgi:hypothetical protein